MCWNAWEASFQACSITPFLEFIPSVLLPLCVYVRQKCFGICTGISIIDSTSLALCKNPRTHSHKVFSGLAKRGKTSTGWFSGFKLHLIFNDRGELLNLLLTPGNVDDRKPVPKLVRQPFGKLFADKGYHSKKLVEELLRTVNIQLITGIRSNMKKCADALDGQTPAAETCHFRDYYRPTQKHFADRAFSPSQSDQLPGQLDLWLDCLLSSAQETFAKFRYAACSHCLTRIHVKLW